MRKIDQETRARIAIAIDEAIRLADAADALDVAVHLAMAREVLEGWRWSREDVVDAASPNHD